MARFARFARIIHIAVLAGVLLIAATSGAWAAPLPSEDNPVVETGPIYIRAVTEVNIRSGPGFNFPIVSRAYPGQVFLSNGVSIDKHWWRVICPAGLSGACWMSADPSLTQVTSAPAPAPAPAQPTPAPAPAVLPTSARYIIALTDVNVRAGPGTSYRIIGELVAGEAALATGVSADYQWWRIVCPDGSPGACWVTAKPHLTQPSQTRH